jgi:hypothetical protein
MLSLVLFSLVLFSLDFLFSFGHDLLPSLCPRHVHLSVQARLPGHCPQRVRQSVHALLSSLRPHRVHLLSVFWVLRPVQLLDLHQSENHQLQNVYSPKLYECSQQSKRRQERNRW